MEQQRRLDRPPGTPIATIFQSQQAAFQRMHPLGMLQQPKQDHERHEPAHASIGQGGLASRDGFDVVA